MFAYEKNRAILLDAREMLPKAPLSTCLGMALTYHRRAELATGGDFLCRNTPDAVAAEIGGRVAYISFADSSAWDLVWIRTTKPIA